MPRLKTLGRPTTITWHEPPLGGQPQIFAKFKFKCVWPPNILSFERISSNQFCIWLQSNCLFFFYPFSLSIMVFYLSIIIYISIYISVSFLFKFKCVLANIVWKDDVYLAALYLFQRLRFIISLISFVSFKINYISYFIHSIPYIRLSLPLPLSWQIVMNH